MAYVLHDREIFYFRWNDIKKKYDFFEYIIALKQKGLKSIFFIFRKWQKNNWHSNNFSTTDHKLTILGHKRGNLAYFENV